MRTIVPLNLDSQSLVVLGNQATVEVTSDQNLLENVPTTQTNVNQTLLQRLPTSSPASGLSDAVILTAPGIATDANGFFTRSETTRRLRFFSTINRLATSKARLFQRSCRSKRFSL
ncbi:MAG: hypothetical protein WKF71_21090 [Pyrinomonadaceae bacterium]